MKRGQVTIFIIIGLIMVISAGLFFYFRSSMASEAELVQPEVVPVRNFVESCIGAVARNGLNILGANGGYITFPKEIENDPLSYLSTGPLNAFKNPYWWYKGISRIPTLESMQEQLNTYIASEIPNCIADFGELQKDYNIEAGKKAEAQTEITDNDIRITMTYPLTIRSKTNDTQIKLSRYNTRIPVRLKKTYELAKSIMEQENQDSFLERKTIDLMALDQEAIPTTGMKVSCSEKKWYVPEVKAKLKELMRVNFPYLKVAGTKFSKDIYVPLPNAVGKEETYENSYLNYNYIGKVTEENNPDMAVAVSHDPGWPMQFTVRPSDGKVLRSNAQRTTQTLGAFCLHIWHFTYDIVYPVRVTVADQPTNDHEGFNFNYAFEVAIDHNQPVRTAFASTTFPPADRLANEEYCNDVTNEITVFTADKFNSEPLPNINLTFVCGSFSCDIGETEWVSNGADSALTKRLPYCVSGVIRGKREGYQESSAFIQTDIPNRHYNLELSPIKEFGNLKVVKHSSSTLVEEPLATGEKATIIVKQPTENLESYGTFADEATEPIRLFTGENFEYDVTVYVIKDNELIGGYEGKWSPNPEEIKQADEIVFHAVVQDPPGSNDDERYAFISALASYSPDLPAPELK